MKAFIALCLLPLISFAQVQIGDNIVGKGSKDQSGNGLALSEDGSTVVVGARLNSDNGTRAGHIRVFRNISGSWSQIGNDIYGEYPFFQEGESVALSSDGNIVATGTTNAVVMQENGYNAVIGHVRVFQYISGSWIQIGEDIEGTVNLERFGRSVSLSSDGSVLAIGASSSSINESNSGHVEVYQNIDGAWEQIGSDILGIAPNDYSGFNVSLSSDGTVLAIGAHFHNSETGLVRVFKNVSDNWVQIGENIIGVGPLNFAGYSISLSSDGSILAIGAIKNSNNGINAGHVRIYQNIEDNWVKIGSDIEGQPSDRSGYSVSLSNNGNVVAIGGPNNSVNGSNSGVVRIYQYINSDWFQVGKSIFGESSGDRSGRRVSLSGDGEKVAIAAPQPLALPSYPGYVKVYDLSSEANCAPPINLNTSNITTTAVDINWDVTIATGSAGFEYVFLTDNLIPDATTIPTGDLEADARSLTKTDLNPFTEYNVYLRAICDTSSSDTGEWSKVLTFSTPCMPFELPFTEDFETSAVGSSSSPNAPDCWNYIKSGYGRTYVINTSVNAKSGEQSFYLRNSVVSTEDYMLISPEITELTTSGIKVIFSSKGEAGQELEVGTISNPKDPSTFTILSKEMLSSSNFEDFEIDIPAGNNSYFAIRHGQTSSYKTFFLDDFSFSTTILSDASFRKVKAKLYPNPVLNTLNIDLPASAKLNSVKLYNLLGKEIRSSQMSSIEISDLNPGIYLVKIQTEQGQFTSKIIKQ